MRGCGRRRWAACCSCAAATAASSLQPCAACRPPPRAACCTAAAHSAGATAIVYKRLIFLVVLQGGRLPHTVLDSDSDCPGCALLSSDTGSLPCCRDCSADAESPATCQVSGVAAAADPHRSCGAVPTADRPRRGQLRCLPRRPAMCGPTRASLTFLTTHFLTGLLKGTPRVHCAAVSVKHQLGC